ncbi:MAG TPA: RNB domain-containing ribonuclease [Actinomycetota bacterium]|nr:RNB domain-containing ribonuclease [Actinomycetota bacterium]
MAERRSSVIGRTRAPEMVKTVLRAPAELPPFREAFQRIRADFDIPTGFPDVVQDEAERTSAAGPSMPDGAASKDRRDARDVPFVTIDPAGSRDLDQAYFAQRLDAGGFRVEYAIADVAAFAAPGGAVETESFRRGVTVYLPDGRAPQLPNVIGEGAASLLPSEERPALLWTIDLDDRGVAVATRLERATIRSRRAMTYVDAQRELDGGGADEAIVLLREIGDLRLGLEATRGGVSLDLPTQDVIGSGTGGFDLRYEAPLPVERWNAQISILAGIQAAKIMIDAGVGILRTVPEPSPEFLARLRHTAQALRVPWPEGARWSDVVRRLDRAKPEQAAFLIQAAHALRGSGYALVDAGTAGSARPPVHAGIGSVYAHVTAPLRRLADRYANEIVLAYCGGAKPPAWAEARLPELVKTMDESTTREARIEHAVIDAVECAVLSGHVGEHLDATVVDQNEHGAIVQITEPAVVAPLAADLPLGSQVGVIVRAVDPVARRVELTPSPHEGPSAQVRNG